MKEKILLFGKSERARFRSRVFGPAFLMCMPVLTWAAPLVTPATLDLTVSTPGLISANWPSEMRAATASGYQQLVPSAVPTAVALANLNLQSSGFSQGFGSVPGGGHYRLVMADTSTTAVIDYNFIFTSTEAPCANASVSSAGNGLAAQSGRWMELSLFKVEQGTNSIALAFPTMRICTNSQGKLDFKIPSIEGGRFKVEITAFNDSNQPTGSYSNDILIEQPSDDSYTSSRNQP